MLHTVPPGQVLIASHPMAHASFTQRCPAAQSAEVRHATQEVCASHFWPLGQSAFAPQTTHAPAKHTCPVVLVAQSLFAWHPPVDEAPSASPFAPSGPPGPVEASAPAATSKDGDPELAQPEGTSATDARSHRMTETASKRRCRSIQSI